MAKKLYNPITILSDEIPKSSSGITIKLKNTKEKEKNKSTESLLGGFSINPNIISSLINVNDDDDEDSIKRRKKRETAADFVNGKRNKVNTTGVDGKGKDKKDPREDTDFYEKRFSEALDHVDVFIDEVDVIKSEVKKDLDAIRSSKQRGALTHIANQTSNLATLLNTKLNGMKEKHTILKNISDLELKKNTKDGTAQSDNYMIDKIFSKIIDNDSRNENMAIQQLMGKKVFDDEDDISDLELRQRTRSLIDNGDMRFTDAELALKYEGRKIEVVVLKSRSTQNWRFIALDEYENEVEDYPLPNPGLFENRLDFNDESRTAKDKLGRIYPVMMID